MPAEPLREIMQIALTVTDLPRAVAFYRDTLQLPLLFEVPRLAFFQAGSIRVMLGLPEAGAPAHAGTPIYFRIGDLPATVEALEARGVAFESRPHLIAKMPDHDLWLAFLRDPDGNPIGLMSEVREG
jgi:methylmalonyl-CoA/ethylmalonyl-CoA epimerase